jgi:hypothetical protein
MRRVSEGETSQYALVHRHVQGNREEMIEALRLSLKDDIS